MNDNYMNEMNENNIPYFGESSDHIYPEDTITKLEFSTNSTNKPIYKYEHTKNIYNISTEHCDVINRLTMIYTDYDKLDTLKQKNDIEQFIINKRFENERYIYCNIENDVSNNRNVKKNPSNHNEVVVRYYTQYYIIGQNNDKRLLEVRYIPSDIY